MKPQYVLIACLVFCAGMACVAADGNHDEHPEFSNFFRLRAANFFGNFTQDHPNPRCRIGQYSFMPRSIPRYIESIAYMAGRTKIIKLAGDSAGDDTASEHDVVRFQGNFTAQCIYAWSKIEKRLKHFGATLNDVVHTVNWLVGDPQVTRTADGDTLPPVALQLACRKVVFAGLTDYRGLPFQPPATMAGGMILARPEYIIEIGAEAAFTLDPDECWY